MITSRHGRILITAAAGRQGQAVSRALLERGWPVRALVRHPEGPAAAHLAEAGAEIVAGDFDDLGSIKAALDDVYGLFLYQPGFMSPEITPDLGPDSELTRGRAVLGAAIAAGIKHLVYSSALGANLGLSPLHAPKRTLEAELVESGLPSTIIRPVGFMENYAGPGRGLQPDGTIRTPAPPDVVEQLIAVRDIGVFTALAFADPDRFVGEAFELAGDELTVSPPGSRQAMGRNKSAPTSNQPTERKGVTYTGSPCGLPNWFRTVPGRPGRWSGGVGGPRGAPTSAARPTPSPGQQRQRSARLRWPTTVTYLLGVAILIRFLQAGSGSPARDPLHPCR